MEEFTFQKIYGANLSMLVSISQTVKEFKGFIYMYREKMEKAMIEIKQKRKL